MYTGAFITFEGIDGSGKTTQMNLLADKLNQYSFKVLLTAEPSAGIAGQLLRRVLSGDVALDEGAIALLFAADRLDHLLNTDGIKKNIENGINVLTDRYFISSFAYQGSALPMKWIFDINSHSMGILRPDLHVFIDIEPETALKRINENRKKIDIYETPKMLKSVRNKYFEAFDLLKKHEKIIIIDGNAHQDIVSDRIWAAVEHLFPVDAAE